MKLVIKNFEDYSWTFIVEPWGMPVTILPNQKLFVVGSATTYANAPEISLSEDTLVCYFYSAEAGIYDESGELIMDISGASPEAITLL